MESRCRGVLSRRVAAPWGPARLKLQGQSVAGARRGFACVRHGLDRTRRRRVIGRIELVESCLRGREGGKE
eukprot:128183-Pleurochrysis_carterae.AAC.1